MTLPLPEFEEVQTWRQGAKDLTVRSQADGLHVCLPAIGRDQELPADVDEALRVDGIARAFPRITRFWNPEWIVPPEDLLPFLAAVGMTLSLRQLRAPRWDDRLADVLGVDWTATLYWTLPPEAVPPEGGKIVQIGVNDEGGVMLEGGDPWLDELRAATGEPLEAPEPTRWRRHDEVSDAQAFVRAVGRWRPEWQSWVQVAVYVPEPR